MEQNLDTSAPIAPAAENNKQNGGNGLKIVTAIACIVAVCGIGFGVYGVIQSSQRDSQISILNSEIIELKQTVEDLKNNTSNDVVEKTEDYILLEELGIKIKKNDSFPNMVVKFTGQGGYEIKESAEAEDFPPTTISIMKVSTCNDDELTLGYSAKIDINGTCYITGEVLPYGNDPEYPLTDFLKYVLNSDNYSAI